MIDGQLTVRGAGLDRGTTPEAGVLLDAFQLTSPFLSILRITRARSCGSRSAGHSASVCATVARVRKATDVPLTSSNVHCSRRLVLAASETQENSSMK